jgi:hypothetical protein
LGCEDLGDSEDFYDLIGLKGEDGDDGDGGLPGDQGPTGPPGDYGIYLLDPALFPPPCDQCIDNVCFADEAVGETLQVVADAVQTRNIAADAVGTGQLADYSVGNRNLKDGSVTGAKIGDGQVAAGKLGAGAVLPGNIAADAVEDGDIAPYSVDTQHFMVDAAAKIWTVTGKTDTSIWWGEPYDYWTDIEDMTLQADGGTGGPYLVLFDASFYMYTLSDTEPISGGARIRLVLLNDPLPPVVLNERPIPVILAQETTWFGLPRYNDLGHFSLHWAGEIDKVQYPLPHVFQIQWKNDIECHYSSYGDCNFNVEQRVSDGTRTLTIIEFKKAQVH